MRKILITMALLLVASFSFAQKENVREAKKIANSAGDFNKAEQLINEALQNPETKDDPETWNIAGLVQQKYNEEEMKKAYLNQNYDTARVYNSVLNMFEYYMKCDDLAQLPDSKGKVKNKYRKSNSSVLLVDRPNLINGGIYYFNNDQNEPALKFFSTYIESTFHPIFEGKKLAETDTLLSQTAYFASLAATKLEKYDKVVEFAPLAKDDKEFGSYAMEFLALAYQSIGDTVKWAETLQEGLKKYPDNEYFFGNLIDYYNKNELYDEAMDFADGMIASHPDNSFYVYVKGFLYHNMKDYDNALKFYEKTIEIDPSYAEAYSNIGLVYSIKGQEYSENATTDINDPQYAKDQEVLKDFYIKAKPYYEKARELAPDNKQLWLQGLYRVYYILDMGKEFEEIEKLMGV